MKVNIFNNFFAQNINAFYFNKKVKVLKILPSDYKKLNFIKSSNK